MSDGQAFDCIARVRKRNPWGKPNPRGRAGRSKNDRIRNAGLGLFSRRRAHQFLSNVPNWVTVIAQYASQTDLAPKNGAKFSLTPSCGGTEYVVAMGPVRNASGANVWLCTPKPKTLPVGNPIQIPLGPGYMTADGWYETGTGCICPAGCVDFNKGTCTCDKVCPPSLATPGQT